MGMTTPVLSYLGYKIIDDDGTEANATALSTNAAYGIGGATTVRVRMGVQETAGGEVKNASWQWQYSLNSGTWTNITTTSSVARAVTSQLVDGNSTTSTSNNRIGSGTFVTANAGQSETGSSGTVTLLSNEADAEVSIQLQSADLSPGNTVDIRVTVDGTLPSGTVARLNYLESLVVTCTTEAVTTSTNNATVTFKVDRNVTGTTEAVTVTENNASVAQNRLVAPPRTTLIYDSFTASDGSGLGFHNPDINVPGNGYLASSASKIYSNQLHHSYNLNALLTSRIDTGTDNHLVESDIYLNDRAGGFAVRMTDTGNYVRAYIHTNGEAYIYKYVGAVPTLIDNSSGLGLSTAAWHHLKCIVQGDNVSLYVNGVLAASGSLGGDLSTGSFAGFFVFAGSTNAMIYDDWYVLSDPAPEEVTVTTNDADVTLVNSLTVQGVTEVVTVAENDAAVAKDLTFTADTEAVTVTENTADVAFDKNIAGQTEVLTVSENTGSITTDRGVTGGTEAVSVTENTASVATDRAVAAQTEQVAVTENNASVGKARQVNGLTEALTVSENNATLQIDRGVIGQTETILVTEGTAIVGGGLLVTGITEVVEVATNDASLAFSLTVTGQTESIVVTEFGASIVFTEPNVWTWDADHFTLDDNSWHTYDGWHIDEFGRDIVGDTVVITLTANAGTVVRDVNFTAQTEVVVVTEGTAQIIKGADKDVTGITEVLTLTENPATVNKSKNITGVTEVLTLTQNNGQVSRIRQIDGVTEQVIVTENPATVYVQRLIDGFTEQVILSENNASISKDRGVAGQSEQIILTEFDALVGKPKSVAGVTEAVEVATNNAQVIGDKYISGATEQLLTTTFAATVNRERRVNTITEEIEIVENDAFITFFSNNRVVDAETAAVLVSTILADITFLLRHIPSQDPAWTIIAPTPGSWDTTAPTQDPGWTAETMVSTTWDTTEPSQDSDWDLIDPTQQGNWQKGSIVN